MNARDGGPAFPGMLPMQDASGTLARDFAFFGGASLRDIFAGLALLGSITTCSRGQEREALMQAMEEKNRTAADQLATDSYAFADAMLRAREVQS